MAVYLHRAAMFYRYIVFKGRASTPCRGHASGQRHQCLVKLNPTSSVVLTYTHMNSSNVCAPMLAPLISCLWLLIIVRHLQAGPLETALDVETLVCF